MCDVCVLFCVKSAPACDTLAVVVVVAAINGLLAALVGGVAYRQCQQNRQTEPCQPRSGTQTDTKGYVCGSTAPEAHASELAKKKAQCSYKLLPLSTDQAK